MPPPRFKPRLATAPHLSHKSALVLLPPSTIQAPIEAVRRTHDKHFARWPPHINLIYPFLEAPSAQSEGPGPPELTENIRSRVKKVTRHIEPFHMSLLTGCPKSFVHGRNSRTVWLQPSSELVSRLQAALQTEFAECDHDPRPFNPHLSLGQAQTDAQQTQLCEMLQNQVTDHAKDGATQELPWLVDTVYVIERKGFRDRFKIIGSIELGKD
jgi:2'-5' RNA ligase